MEKTWWEYEKLDENGDMKTLPPHDLDGAITGRKILNLKSWMDENPEERIRLGYIKHIHPREDSVEYNRQTQYLVQSLRQIDDYTVEDVYHVLDKSEDQMALEEMLESAVPGVTTIGGFTFFGGI